MSFIINSSLAEKLVGAHQIVETVVLRTNDGSVYTIEVGQSVMENSSNAFGAKITHLRANQSTHIGVCEGDSVEQVVLAAQELIDDAVSTKKAAA